MKLRSKSGAAADGYAKAMMVGGVVILILASGYYSGYRRAIGADKGPISSGDSGGGPALAPAAEATRGAADENQAAGPMTAKPKPRKKEPMRVQDFPPAHLKRFREAEAFVLRIPEMEQALLDQHPLLEHALRLEDELKQSLADEGPPGEAKRHEALLSEWESQSPRNEFAADMRTKILRLDTYLELMDDPEYRSFIEDRLSGGLLSDEMPRLLRFYLGDGGGLDFEGVELIGAGITGIDKYRQAFHRYAEAIKAKPGNQFALEALPDEIEQAAWQRALNSSQRIIIDYYQHSILPEELANDYSRHYRSMQIAKNAHFLKPNSPEVIEFYDELRANRILGSRFRILEK